MLLLGLLILEVLGTLQICRHSLHLEKLQILESHEVQPTTKSKINLRPEDSLGAWAQLLGLVMKATHSDTQKIGNIWHVLWSSNKIL